MSSHRDISIVEDFKTTTNRYFSERNAYARVHVLMLWWHKNDLHPENEIRALRSLLEHKFNYTVSTFEIPDDGSQHYLLIRRLLDTREEHSAQDSLLIIYYAGHCDSDERGKVRWAASVHSDDLRRVSSISPLADSKRFRRREQDGADLSWHVAQQLLFEAQGDVLLLLDCCNAASLASGHKRQGRFEMIAACAKETKTVAPSYSSFTRILIRSLEPFAAGGIFADNLAAIIREDRNITATTVFHDFVHEDSSDSTKIRLHRLTQPQPIGFSKKPTDYMLLRVDLVGNIRGKAIADWLKTGAPKQVTAVEIEALVSRASQLQGFQNEAFTPGSTLSNISQSAKNEVLKSIHNLHTTMAIACHHAEDVASQDDTKLAQGALADIQHSVAAVCTAVETTVLQELEEQKQETAAQDQFVAITGTPDTVVLRKAVRGHGAPPAPVQIPFEDLLYNRNTDELRAIATHNQSSIIVEIFAYQNETAEDELADDLLKNVRRISALLSQAGQLNFRTLPCRGFFYDQGRGELGLVFEAPPKLETSTPLATLLQLYVKYPMMPLGHRLHLAHSLAVAMDRFHRVGWVHKSYRSGNIVFCPMSAMKDSELSTDEDENPKAARWKEFDLVEPYIFGYDDARPQGDGTLLNEDYLVENNLYRHPDRWGNPRVTFQKTHDIYALAIVLIEIALWKSMGSVLSPTSREPGTQVRQPRRLTSTEVAAKVRKICQNELPRRVGHVLTQAIRTCLDFNELTLDMSEYESQLFFQQHVCGTISEAVGHV